MNRRVFLAAPAALSAAQTGAKRLPIKKAVLMSMLPKDLSFKDRFQLARDCGFEQIEIQTVADPKEAGDIRKASEATGLGIHSVMNSDHWRYPLSSADGDVVGKCVAGMETSLRNANEWGAETVLLVPAVVDPKTGYGDAWKRSQKEIRKMIPLAEKLKVIIAVEEVWNKFLLSPLEFARYVDEFQSPWVRAYFDVGNVVLYGYPQDWIRTLGKRIVKLHLKDFSFRQDPATRKRVADFVNLGDGDIDWKAIYAALSEIGYKGSATVELAGGDAAYLKDVSRRVDRILEGV
ncbi:MAG: sugar phosphate isomerase/epimerase family protein [Bryobacteraceae bacterium]|nr:sugar phosphate isomerase/epimerase family protein [Bryobacteraceae bacterium]